MNLKFWASAVAAGKNTIFPVVELIFFPIAECRVLYVSAISAPYPAIAPTISLASSNADVSMVSLVVLPLDVVEGIILATSDPYVSTVQCMSTL